MLLAEPLWNQLDRLSQQLIARITENPFGLKVEHLDPSGAIDHHHRIGRGFDRALKALPAAPKLVLDSLLLRKVAGQHRKTSEPFRSVAHGGDGHICPKARSVLTQPPSLPFEPAAAATSSRSGFPLRASSRGEELRNAGLGPPASGSH